MTRIELEQQLYKAVADALGVPVPQPRRRTRRSHATLPKAPAAAQGRQLEPA